MFAGSAFCFHRNDTQLFWVSNSIFCSLIFCVSRPTLLPITAATPTQQPLPQNDHPVGNHPRWLPITATTPTSYSAATSTERSESDNAVVWCRSIVERITSMVDCLGVRSRTLRELPPVFQQLMNQHCATFAKRRGLMILEHAAKISLDPASKFS